MCCFERNGEKKNSVKLSHFFLSLRTQKKENIKCSLVWAFQLFRSAQSRFFLFCYFITTERCWWQCKQIVTSGYEFSCGFFALELLPPLTYFISPSRYFDRTFHLNQTQIRIPIWIFHTDTEDQIKCRCHCQFAKKTSNFDGMNLYGWRVMVVLSIFSHKNSIHDHGGTYKAQAFI